MEIVDLAPTVMALLGLPVPRDCTGVFIDDIVGLITANDAEGSLLGTNCTETDAMAEADKQLSQDRMCKASCTDPNPHPRRATGPTRTLAATRASGRGVSAR